MRLMTKEDTTALSYWLNWRFLLCAIWVLTPMLFASFLIWRYEGSKDSKADQEENTQETAGSLYEDEAWRPCLKQIHPAWLLAYRTISFFMFLSVLLADVIVVGPTQLYYYTQWTFTSVTIYFGLGSVLSICGCYQYCYRDGGNDAGLEEQDIYAAPPSMGNGNGNGYTLIKNSGPQEQHYVRQTASVWVYAFQILFQMNAGAVMLTDCVYWLVIVPFLDYQEYKLSVLMITMHSANAVFLLGDTLLNSLRFPWFRMAYFILWTGIFVVFQWILHACVSMWWPYPFLDLSSPYSPIWYLCVALLHLPCYATFVLIVKIKHVSLSRWFPESYQCVR